MKLAFFLGEESGGQDLARGENSGQMMDPTSDEITDLMAERFQLLADSTRLAILRTLMSSGELNVGSLVEATGRSQANVSKHLKLLTNAGLVARRKKGLQVYYRLNDPVVEQICRLVRDSLLQEMQAQRKQDRNPSDGRTAEA
jgi:ArsR family transcriptional regulator